MSFNSVQKKFLKENIVKISTMNKIELDTYAQKLYMAKYDMAKSVFEMLIKAIDERIKELHDKSENMMAVYASIEYED